MKVSDALGSWVWYVQRNFRTDADDADHSGHVYDAASLDSVKVDLSASELTSSQLARDTADFVS